jgi:hypothetical protein
MPKTKSFRVAVEGDTVDGRKIERIWLTDIAATYNPATYGARVNKEHIAGMTGNEPFKAYGDVISCSVEEIDLELGGKTVKRLALNAEIEATDDLVQLVADKQKIYTSIEVMPNFANTGKAGLVGLAVTDTPASLGTEVLSFALKHPGLSPNLPRPKDAGNVFSLGLETTFALADGGTPIPPQSEEARGFFTAATAFFQKLTAGAPATPVTPVTPATPAPAPEPANDNDKFAAIAAGMVEMGKGIEQISKDFGTQISGLKTELLSVKTSIQTTDPDPQRRSLSTGGTGGVATDC